MLVAGRDLIVVHVTFCITHASMVRYAAYKVIYSRNLWWGANKEPLARNNKLYQDSVGAILPHSARTWILNSS